MSGFDVRLFMLSGTGVLICLAGIYALATHTPARTLAITWSFGGVFLIGGVFGLDGIREFSQFVSVLKPMLVDPSAESYSNALRKIGEGKLSEENAEMAAAIAVTRPIPDIASIVEAEAARATDSVGRNVLTILDRNVKAQDSLASHLATELSASGMLNERSFRQLDRTSQALVARKLLFQPGALTQQQQRVLQDAARISPTRTRRN